MRVATIFTGVAAATVGVVQVANAQEGGPATTHKPASKNIARLARPAIRSFRGSIESKDNCYLSAKTLNTWVHADWWSEMYDMSKSICYGFKGEEVSPPGVGVTYLCGGNNHGQVWGYNAGRSWDFKFGPGTTYVHLNKASMDVVSIWSWTGNDKCANRLY